MTQPLTETSIDLDAYLQRIGYDGERTPTLDTLRAIHARHATMIPFENLTPLLRQPVRLDTASLQHKLVQRGRGGYCFEDEVVTARGHMLLRVDIDGQAYLADVGFGGLTLTAPLALIPDIEQPTPHEPFRVIADGDGYMMQAYIGQIWKSLYRFDLQEQHVVDYEVSNWYLSNNPNSHFVTGLMAARPDGDRRYALRNNQLAIHHRNGATERRVLTTVAELRAILQDGFRITLPDTPDLDPTLQRLVEQSQRA
jgi:N-hydroxyarylamine O-acetyltransferase